jgi:hypothetical protein
LYWSIALASKTGPGSEISVATETGGWSEIRLDYAQLLAHGTGMNQAAQALGRLGGLAGTGKAKARTREQARHAAMVRHHGEDKPIEVVSVPVVVVPVVREAREPLLKRSGKIL